MSTTTNRRRCSCERAVRRFRMTVWLTGSHDELEWSRVVVATLSNEKSARPMIERVMSLTRWGIGDEGTKTGHLWSSLLLNLA